MRKDYAMEYSPTIVALPLRSVEGKLKIGPGERVERLTQTLQQNEIALIFRRRVQHFRNAEEDDSRCAYAFLRREIVENIPQRRQSQLSVYVRRLQRAGYGIERVSNNLRAPNAVDRS